MAENNDSNSPPSNGAGYGKPPEHTRFRKGKSGNPKGRPKGSLNLATVLARTLREKVVVNENGKKKTITKLQAATKQLVNRAASGDLPALKELMRLVAVAEESAVRAPSADTPLSEADERIMQEILERFGKSNKGDGDDEPK